MRKFVILASVLILLITGCAGDPFGDTGTTTTTTAVSAERVSVPSGQAVPEGVKAYFEDTNFSKGIQVDSLPDDNGNKKRRTLRFDSQSSSKASWSMSQLFSKFDIVGLDPMDFGGGVCGYQNEGKTISILTDEDGDRALRLEVCGETEYPVGEQRSNWPHLLLCYEFKDHTSVATYENLVYSMDTRIIYSNSALTEGQQPTNANTAQTTVYFTIQNLNTESEEYGEYYWFGLPVFDSRYDFPSAFQVMDEGEGREATNQLIYVLGGEEFLNTYYGGVNPRNGEWAHLEIDILPYLKTGFEAAKQSGRMTGTNWEDIGIGSYNFGWEVPGTINCGMEMANIQLLAYEKTEG